MPTTSRPAGLHASPHDPASFSTIARAGVSPPYHGGGDGPLLAQHQTIRPGGLKCRTPISGLPHIKSPSNRLHPKRPPTPRQPKSAAQSAHSVEPAR